MKRAAVLGAALFVAGCATPTVEDAGLRRGARVGIVNLMRPQMTHHHAGASSLDSFEKWSVQDPELPRFVTEQLRKTLRHHDYILVLVEPTPELLAVGRNVIPRYQGAPSRAVVAGVQQLAREHRLDHVLLVSETWGPAPPPRTGELWGYGLHTEAAGKPFAYFNVAVLRLSPEGELLRPLTLLSSSETTRELSMEFQPKDADHATAEELGRVAPFVRGLVERRIRDADALVR